MKFKIIGYLLLFLSCAATGFSVSKYYKAKISCSLAYINFLSGVLEKIDILHLPLSKIYESIYDLDLEKIGFFEILKAQGLRCAYEKHENKFMFDPEHLEFCDKLGTLPHGDTVKLCNYEINRLKKLLETQRDTCERKIRLCPALSILIGVAVIILII